MKTSVLGSLLGWRPANLLKRDSCTGVFWWVLLKKEIRTTFWQDNSERLYLNLSQPAMLKYLLTTLQSNKAFTNDFICSLMFNFRGVLRTLSNIRFGCYLLTISVNPFRSGGTHGVSWKTISFSGWHAWSYMT